MGIAEMLREMTVKSTVAHDYRFAGVSSERLFQACDAMVSVRHEKADSEFGGR
ncbi:hypothetical protein [Nocardia abscessus]|uniref:hypothetical protein n=1 Tax=Nocardia abscessus TaxID=120957 RepID=UPI0002DCEFD5|nr:hypothetical protein [Nocardia abscessus]MCC3329317.1 hypothetical protein [Nocardia abscessus]